MQLIILPRGLHFHYARSCHFPYRDCYHETNRLECFHSFLLKCCVALLLRLLHLLLSQKKCNSILILTMGNLPLHTACCRSSTFLDLINATLYKLSAAV